MTTQARELAKLVSNAGDLTFGDDIHLLSDAGVLNFGADNDVTLTHVADTGLLLNSSRQLQFGDSGTFIRQEADGVLDITSDTEVEINATTVDINANVDISGNLVLGGNITIGDADSDDISFGGELTSHIIPNADDTYDLGSSTKQWRNAYVDGTLYVDAIDLDGTALTAFNTDAAQVFNESGAAVDFRVEGDNNANLLFVDGSADRVGIGTNSPSNNLHIFTDNGDEGILIKATGDTSNAIVSDANRGNAGATLNAFQGKWNGTAVADISFLTGADTTNKDDGHITFSTASAGSTTEAMRISSAGDVGIGTASPGAKLEVSGASTRVQVSDTGTSFTAQDFLSNSDAVRATIGVERSSGGGLFVGSTAYAAVFGSASSGNTEFASNNTIRMTIDTEGNISFGNEKVDPNWSQFFNAISGNFGGHVSFQNNNVPVTTLGNNFYINNSTANERVLAYPSQQFKLDHQQNFLWESAASGTAGDTFSFTEHMRLTSGGVLSIGDATPESGDASAPTSLYLEGGEANMIIKNTDATSSSQRQGIAFLNSSGTRVGTIKITSSATGYATSSDYRLKENVSDMTDATTRLKELKPKRFNWIADETNTLVDGFLAHEVQSVVPEAITGEKDGGEMQGIDQSKLIPLLVKTIQELEARIATLEG